GARDLPLHDRAVGLLLVEEPADVRVDHRELGQRARELATLRGVELRLQRVMRDRRLCRQTQGDNRQKTEYLFHNHLSAKMYSQRPYYAPVVMPSVSCGATPRSPRP